MMVGVLDTHAIIWYLSRSARLSTPARTFIVSAITNKDQIGISSISLVEITYLIEKGKIPSVTFTLLATTLDDPKTPFIEIPLNLQVARALSRIDSSKVPDMPDRIIAATALSRNVPLVSRDAKIQSSGIITLW